MPLVRVDMHTTLAPQKKQISAAIHTGLVDGLEMPADDLFQIFTVHEQGDLVYTTTFPNADRTDILYIQILLAKIYDAEQKSRMYTHLVAELKAIGIKQDNILIALTENEGADWFAPEKEA
jgi:hypothetical protein